jgi:hypothetical protein
MGPGIAVCQFSALILEEPSKIGDIIRFTWLHHSLPYSSSILRLPRIFAPGYPHPVTQRGVRSLSIFRWDEDRACMIRGVVKLLTKTEDQDRPPTLQISRINTVGCFRSSPV